MNKRELDILEKAFSMDINNCLYPCNCKTAKNLAKDGYLKWKETTIGRRFPVTIKGYQITHKGVFAYSASDRCKDEPTNHN